MPRSRKSASKDPAYESRIKAALEGLNSGLYISIAEAARAQRVARQTLQDRAKGRHVSSREAQRARQLLNTEEENVLLDWCAHQGLSAMPIGPKSLRAHAFRLTGRHPGKNWHTRFGKRHPKINLSAPNGLDPKRAQNFNKTTVADYFDQRARLDEEFGPIPPENDWNMDEKGVQMGGGRHHDGSKFYYLRGQKNRYRIHSDNLELVTVVECISAAGEAIPPSFILQDGPIPDCSAVEGVGRYVGCCITIFQSLTAFTVLLLHLRDGPTAS